MTPTTVQGFAAAAYAAVKDAQEALDRAMEHELVELDVWFDENKDGFQAKGAVKAQRLYNTIFKDRVRSMEEYKEAIEHIQTVLRAFDHANRVLASRTDFDVIVHVRPEVFRTVKENKIHIGFSVLQRISSGPNGEHDRTLRESMLRTITEMRERGHRDTAIVQQVFEDRFGKPWREEIAADDNPDSQPNYNLCNIARKP